MKHEMTHKRDQSRRQSGGPLSCVVAVLHCVGLCVFALACAKKPDFGSTPGSSGFNQQYTTNNKVDVLWVVDNSSSMAVHQSDLAKQFGSFIDVLTQNGLDFNLAVTTMDMGGSGQKGVFVGTTKILNSSMATAKNIFINNVQVGTSGSALSRGLEAMQAALSAPNITSGNAGFLRSDARLVVIFVTDDDDKSSGTPSDYSTFLDKLKPVFPYNQKGWMINFIGVTAPNQTCQTGQSGLGFPGDRYITLANSSAGLTESICSDHMAQALANIRSRIVGMITQWHLGRTPDVKTIVVKVDGNIIPQDPVNGWTYIADQRVVVFNGSAIPGPSSSVTIDYVALSAQ